MMGGAWLSLVLVACGTSPTALCEQACECSGCSERELEDCIDELEDDEKRAEEEGCDSEFSDMLDCFADELECKGGDDVEIDGCEGETDRLNDCLGRSSRLSDDDDETTVNPPPSGGGMGGAQPGS